MYLLKGFNQRRAPRSWTTIRIIWMVLIREASPVLEKPPHNVGNRHGSRRKDLNGLDDPTNKEQILHLKQYALYPYIGLNSISLHIENF